MARTSAPLQRGQMDLSIDVRQASQGNWNLAGVVHLQQPQVYGLPQPEQLELDDELMRPSTGPGQVP